MERNYFTKDVLGLPSFGWCWKIRWILYGIYSWNSSTTFLCSRFVKELNEIVKNIELLLDF